MNQIENEYHFLLVCPFYNELRTKFLPRYYCVWPTINKIKFISIMQSSNKSRIIRLAKFIYFAVRANKFSDLT